MKEDKKRPRNNREHILHLATLAVFTVIGLTIHIIEGSIPTLIPIPGIKPGLANIVTLILLACYSPADAFLVLLVRILLSAILTGQAVSLLYSLCGGVCCFLVMVLFHRLFWGHFLYLTSIFGALAHNAGQLFAAYFFTHTIGVTAYIPFLIVSAILTGLFTGLCAHYAQKYLMPHIPG